VKVPAVLFAGLLAVLVAPIFGSDGDISADRASYALTARVVSPADQSIWTLAARTEGGQRTFEIRHTGRSGQWQTVSIPLNPPLERFEEVAAATGNGDVYFAGWAEGRLHLVKLDASGKVVFVRPLGVRSARLVGLVPASNRGVLLFGRSDRGAFAAKVDDSGLRLWTIDIDEHPRAAVFTNAALENDGSCILTANIYDRREEEFNARGGRKLRITVDPRGRIVQSKSFPEPLAASTVLEALGND